MLGKRRRAGLDKRSKVRFRVLPYMPRTFDQGGIANERAGLIGGWFLISEGIAEVALPYGNLIGPSPVMERLAEFVDRPVLRQLRVSAHLRLSVLSRCGQSTG